MANFFDQFDPNPAPPPVPGGANFFAEFAPPANAKRGGKTPAQQLEDLFANSAPTAGPLNTFPMAAQKAVITSLRQNPNDPELRAGIDQRYGTGTAERIAGPLKGRGTMSAAQMLDQIDPLPASAAPPAGGSIRTMTPDEEKALQSTPDRGTSIADKIFAAARGAADTATFGLNDRILAGLGASLDVLKGQEFDYSKNLEHQRGVTEYERENNPIPFVGGQLAGGFALPVGAAAEGATLGARILRGGLTGAAQGAAYNAGSSEDLTNLPDVAKNAATGAALGGTIGGAAPAVVSGVLGGTGKALSLFRGLRNSGEEEAAARVANALQKDAAKAKFNEGTMQAAQDIGQPMAVMDMGGEATRDLARSAANTSPEARQALHDVTDARFESQSPRIAEFVSGLGGGSDATTTLEKLQADAKAANRPAYAKAFADGASGVWNDDLSNLMRAPAVQDAVRGAIKTGANRDVAQGFSPVKAPFSVAQDGTIAPRVNPDGSSAIPSLQFWDGVKRNLDDTVSRLQRSGEKSAASDAITLKSQLVDALDRAVPSYAKARGTAAQFFGAQDSVEAGAKLVSDRRPNPEIARAVSKMSPPEKQLFGHGFASALADKIEKVPDRSSAINAVFNSPSARERVTMALGEEKASKLKAYLDVESAMDAMRKAVQGNSTTARQLATLGVAGGLGGAIDYLHGGSFTAGAITGAALGHLARHGKIKIDQRIAHSVGRMLSSSNPEDYKKLLALTQKSKRVQDAVHAFTPRAVAAILPVALNELHRYRSRAAVAR